MDLTEITCTLGIDDVELELEFIYFQIRGPMGVTCSSHDKRQVLA